MNSTRVDTVPFADLLELLTPMLLRALHGQSSNYLQPIWWAAGIQEAILFDDAVTAAHGLVRRQFFSKAGQQQPMDALLVNAAGSCCAND
jgi:hypothetical protein